MNREALVALGKMLERARREKRLTAYQVGQATSLATWFVSSVENGEIDANHVGLEKLVEFYGLPLKLVDGCKRPSRPISLASGYEPAPMERSNVVVLDTYRKQKWRQTSLFEKD